jgi:hypothetical protein
MISRKFIKKHVTSFAILLFLIVYLTLNYTEPFFLYTREGYLRQFGLGYKNKTIIPLWLIAIFIAILSYVSVLYWLTIPKIHY